jgi:tetratricopeptide (TPR) repeat protein
MPFVSRVTLLDVIEHVFSGKRIPHSSLCIDDAVRSINQSPAPEAGARWGRFDSYVGAVVDIAAQLAAALAYTHNKGIFHCDIKPTNVLVTDHGQAMLLDFNLSVVEERRDVALGGTLPYMAPEQLRTLLDSELAAEFHVDAQLDIYSLGVTLFELLSGEFPGGQLDEAWDRNTQIEFLLHAARRPQQAVCDQKLAWVDPQLRKLVADCLSEDPQRRPPSAEYVARELKSFQTGRGKFRRWLKCNRAAVLILTLTYFLCLTIGFSMPAGHNALAKLGMIPEPNWMAAERLLQEGWDSQALGRYEEAVVSFTSVLEFQPENHSARFARGRCFLITDNEMGALEDLREVVQATRSPVAFAYLGCCFGRLKNYTLAAEHYKWAHQRGFRNPQTQQSLAHALIYYNTAIYPGSGEKRFQDLADAESIIKQSLKIDDTNAISRWVFVDIVFLRLLNKRQAHQAQKHDLSVYLTRRQQSSLPIDRMSEMIRHEQVLHELTRKLQEKIEWALEIEMESGADVKFAAELYSQWPSRPGTPQYKRQVALIEDAMQSGAGREWLYRQVKRNESLAREPRLMVFWENSKPESAPIELQYYVEPLGRRDTQIRL